MRSLALSVLVWMVSPGLVLAQDAEGEEETNVAAMEQAGEGMDDERARSHFRAGSNLYDAGSFERAGQEFEQAYELSGRPELLYNVYVAYRDAGMIREAKNALARYLEEAETVEDRVNLEARLRSLEDQVAALDMAEEEAAAREEEAEQRETGGIGSPPPPPPPADDGPGVGPWVVIGVGGAAIVAGAITGVLALGAVGDIEDECPDDVCPSDYDELEEDRDDARTLVTATDFLLLGGAVVAAGGVAWLLLGGDSGEAPPADVGAACTGEGCMATLRGRF